MHVPLSLSPFLSRLPPPSLLLLCTIRKRENRWTVKFDAGCRVSSERNVGREERIYDTASAHIAIFSFGSGERDDPVLKVAAGDTISLFKFIVLFSRAVWVIKGSHFRQVSLFNRVRMFALWNLSLPWINYSPLFQILSPPNANNPDKQGTYLKEHLPTIRAESFIKIKRVKTAAFTSQRNRNRERSLELNDRCGRLCQHETNRHSRRAGGYPGNPAGSVIPGAPAVECNDPASNVGIEQFRNLKHEVAYNYNNSNSGPLVASRDRKISYTKYKVDLSRIRFLVKRKKEEDDCKFESII